ARHRVDRDAGGTEAARRARHPRPAREDDDDREAGPAEEDAERGDEGQEPRGGETRSGSRGGGGSEAAAGRNAMWAKNIPPTHTTMPVTCSHSAIRMLERSAKATILTGGPAARPPPPRPRPR